MFERGNRAVGPLNVEITLADGRELKGNFVVPQGRTLAEILNGTANFIEFQVAGARRTFVAKSTILTAAVSDVDLEPTHRSQQSDDIPVPS